MRPTADLQSEAWGNGEAQPASRTIPRSTLTRSPVDRTQPMNARAPSNRVPPPSAAGNGARSTVSPKPSAYRSPRPGPSPEQQAAADAEVERMGQQVVELLERVRQGDERAAYLEQQLQHMTHMANAAAAAATAMPQPMVSVSDDVLKPKPNNSWIAWTAFGLLGALVVAAYALGYVPLRSQFDELTKQNVLQASQSTAALEKLKSSFSDERQALQSQLAAAQAAASTAQQAAAAPEPTTSRSRSAAADSDDEDDDSGSTRMTSEEREAKKAERLAKREERKAAYEAKKAERLAKREERKAAAEERKAARAESSSSRKHASDDEDEPAPAKPAKASRPADEGDDPLQGLDGL